MKYIVIELQTNSNDSVASIVTQYNTRNEPDSKFHTVLAAAAVSSVPTHAAVILNNQGELISEYHYIHSNIGE